MYGYGNSNHKSNWYWTEIRNKSPEGPYSGSYMTRNQKVLGLNSIIDMKGAKKGIQCSLQIFKSSLPLQDGKFLKSEQGKDTPMEHEGSKNEMLSHKESINCEE